MSLNRENSAHALMEHRWGKQQPSACERLSPSQAEAQHDAVLSKQGISILTRGKGAGHAFLIR
jgi:hypothetical protein